MQIRGYTLTGWAVTSVLSPIFLFASAWVVLRFLTGGANPSLFEQYTGYPAYLPFVVLGVAFNGLVTSALEDGGNAVYEEESHGTWDLLALAPFNRFVWMFSKTLAGLVTGFVDFFAVLALGALVLDVPVTGGGLVVALAGIAATVLALQGFGFTMAAIGLVWKQPFVIAFILSPVILLLSGMMFPIHVLPAWVQPISNALPLTHGLKIVRDALLLDAGFADLGSEFQWLALTGLGFMLVGYASFRAMERRARRLGVMGRY